MIGKNNITNMLTPIIFTKIEHKQLKEITHQF